MTPRLDSHMRKIKKIIWRFKRWMDYDPPGALTSTGWRLFKKEFKEKAPIRWWFKETLRYSIMLPLLWKIEKAQDWFRYRTYDRYHVCSTGLPPAYYGVDEQMLHVNFNILKNFVEVEQAWHTYMWSDERKPPNFFERFVPFYRYVRPFRSREWGLRYLDWAATLDDPALPPQERCDHQAAAAREIRTLYLWWVDQRPARKEFEHKEYSDQGLGTLACLDDDFNRTAADFLEHSQVMEKNAKLREDWEAEDTEMLIRLVKIRQSLWT